MYGRDTPPEPTPPQGYPLFAVDPIGLFGWDAPTLTPQQNLNTRRALPPSCFGSFLDPGALRAIAPWRGLVIVRSTRCQQDRRGALLVFNRYTVDQFAPAGSFKICFATPPSASPCLDADRRQVGAASCFLRQLLEPPHLAPRSARRVFSARYSASPAKSRFTERRPRLGFRSRFASPQMRFAQLSTWTAFKA